MRYDDGILAEVMVAEAGLDKKERDPLTEQFVELRQYIEHSHDRLSGRIDVLSERVDGLSERVDGLSERVDGLSERVNGLSGRVEKVEAGQQRLERKVDAGFDRLARKIDALTPARRVPPRRRKP